MKKSRRFHSIRGNFMATYIVIIAAILVFLNTYPLTVSRDLIFASKKTELQSQAGVIGVALEALDRLDGDSVARVMTLINTKSDNTVAVFDDEDELVYKTLKSEDFNEMGVDIDWCRKEAKNGRDSVYSSLNDGVFRSVCVVPVMKNDAVNGTVLVYESDREQGANLKGLQSNLKKITIAICIVSVGLSLLFSMTMSRRIILILNGIKNVRNGEYGYRISISGNDEISELADEFNSLTDRLQSIEEVRRRFVSDASHELKTPLASIRLLSDSILQEPDMDRDMEREFVNDIRNEAERLARITEKLLNLTRMDNKIVHERTEVDVKKVIESTVKVLLPIAANRDVTVETSLSEDCHVFATEDDIYQIVMNLTENAIKYNVPGGSVNVTLDCVENTVRIAVEDTGIGIPDKDMPNIYNRFYRVDKARSREMGGSGLGLSIVKSTVLQHGGEIRASKREEGGMCFTVSFPRYIPNTQI